MRKTTQFKTQAANNKTNLQFKSQVKAGPSRKGRDPDQPSLMVFGN